MRSHKDLDVWKMAVKLAGRAYEITENYPRTEKYGITSQIRRAAVSISANIAEGAARQSKKEFIQYLSIAMGSASEVDTLIEISLEIKMGNRKDLLELQANNIQISKMLGGLIRSLKGKMTNG